MYTAMILYDITLLQLPLLAIVPIPPCHMTEIATEIHIMYGQFISMQCVYLMT